MGPLRRRCEPRNFKRGLDKSTTLRGPKPTVLLFHPRVIDDKLIALLHGGGGSYGLRVSHSRPVGFPFFPAPDLQNSRRLSLVSERYVQELLDYRVDEPIKTLWGNLLIRGIGAVFPVAALSWSEPSP